MRDELTPQQRLAQIVAEETDGGRRVVRFFVKVAEGELDHQGFKPNHRMDSAKELVKVGLTEFDDYIRANHATAARRAPRTRRPAPDPETEQARQELADYARELTGRRQNRHKTLRQRHGRTQRATRASSPTTA